MANAAVVNPVAPAMKTKTIPLFLGLSALVCLAHARAVTIAENTAGTQVTGSAFWGQSFTTAPGSPTSSIAFNFFSFPGATTPVAVGDGFLLSMQYLGTPAALSSSTPGFLGQSDGLWWLLHIRSEPDPLTKYAILFLRDCAYLRDVRG